MIIENEEIVEPKKKKSSEEDRDDLGFLYNLFKVFKKGPEDKKTICQILIIQVQ